MRSPRGWCTSIPKHEAGKLIQRITKGTLRATEARTDGRYAEDDKYVELDYELAVALANVTEGAARATVLKVTQTEPSHGFVASQALVDGHAPKSSNDPAIALQPILATPKRCKDAKELKERLTAWSLKVAEYERQFKVNVVFLNFQHVKGTFSLCYGVFFVFLRHMIFSSLLSFLFPLSSSLLSLLTSSLLFPSLLLSVDRQHRYGHWTRLLRLPDLVSWHIVVSSFVRSFIDLCLIRVATSFGSRKQLSEFHLSW